MHKKYRNERQKIIAILVPLFSKFQDFGIDISKSTILIYHLLVFKIESIHHHLYFVLMLNIL